MNPQKHAFHLVDPSPWPLFGSLGALASTMGGVMYMHSYIGGGALLSLGLGMLIYTMIVWWRDVVREATYEGHHTGLVQIGLRYGMILFFVEEVMLFLAFFWAFFHSSLAPTVEIGAIWPPKGIEVLNPWGISFLNTLILLSLGAAVAWTLHAILARNRQDAIFALIATIFGFFFAFFRYVWLFIYPLCKALSIYQPTPFFDLSTCLNRKDFSKGASRMGSERDEQDDNLLQDLDQVTEGDQQDTDGGVGAPAHNAYLDRIIERYQHDPNRGVGTPAHTPYLDRVIERSQQNTNEGVGAPAHNPQNEQQSSHLANDLELAKKESVCNKSTDLLSESKNVAYQQQLVNTEVDRDILVYMHNSEASTSGTRTPKQAETPPQLAEGTHRQQRVPQTTDTTGQTPPSQAQATQNIETTPDALPIQVNPPLNANPNEQPNWADNAVTIITYAGAGVGVTLLFAGAFIWIYYADIPDFVANENATRTADSYYDERVERERVLYYARNAEADTDTNFRIMIGALEGTFVAGLATLRRIGANIPPNSIARVQEFMRSIQLNQRPWAGRLRTASPFIGALLQWLGAPGRSGVTPARSILNDNPPERTQEQSRQNAEHLRTSYRRNGGNAVGLGLIITVASALVANGHVIVRGVGHVFAFRSPNVQNPVAPSGTIPQNHAQGGSQVTQVSQVPPQDHTQGGSQSTQVSQVPPQDHTQGGSQRPQGSQIPGANQTVVRLATFGYAGGITLAAIFLAASLVSGDRIPPELVNIIGSVFGSARNQSTSRDSYSNSLFDRSNLANKSTEENGFGEALIWENFELQEWCSSAWTVSLLCLVFRNRSLLSVAFNAYFVSKSFSFTAFSLKSSDCFPTHWIKLQSDNINSDLEPFVSIATSLFYLSLIGVVSFLTLSIALYYFWYKLPGNERSKIVNSPIFSFLFIGLFSLLSICSLSYSMSVGLLELCQQLSGRAS